MQASYFLSEDQRIFRETLRRLLAEGWTVDKRRQAAATEPGYDRALWKRLAELGALGAFLPEAAGGSGGGGLDLMLVMEELGRALVGGPMLGSVVAGSALLGTDRLAGVAEGKRTLALAIGEDGSRFDLNHVETRIEGSGATQRISGRKRAVPYGGSADLLLVTARSHGDTRDPGGVTLLAIERTRPGVTVETSATVDSQRHADITLNKVEATAADVIGEADKGLDPLGRAIDLVILAQAAEAVGAMQALHDATLAYIKVREQFGATLGSFQALQHRMVDMFAAVEISRSRVQSALAAVTSPTDTVPPRTAVLTKLFVDRQARLVGQDAIQLHGGMGMTDDLAVGHYVKRLTMIGQSFGDAWHLNERFRALQDPA